MTRRHFRADELARRSRHQAALARPELRGSAGEARRAPAGPTSAPIKVQDEETRRLIDAALAKRKGATR